MRWLLNLYPHAWQRRYRGEVEEYLASEPTKLRTVLDLVAGAIDARLNPGWIPNNATTAGGERTMSSLQRYGSLTFSEADAGHAAGWILGTSLLLVGIGVALDKTLGPRIMVDALLYSSFFIALTVSFGRYFRMYSRTARNIMIGLVALAWYAFFLAVTAAASMV